MTKKPTVTRRSSAGRSPVTKMLSRLRSSQDMRRHKVRRVKAAIKSSSYENSLKLEVGIDRLLDQLLGK